MGKIGGNSGQTHQYEDLYFTVLLDVVSWTFIPHLSILYVHS